MPTSTKHVGAKNYVRLEQPLQKLSAGNVLLKAVALPLWAAIDKR
jgi:hypothetical protein